MSLRKTPYPPEAGTKVLCCGVPPQDLCPRHGIWDGPHIREDLGFRVQGLGFMDTLGTLGAYGDYEGIGRVYGGGFSESGSVYRGLQRDHGFGVSFLEKLAGVILKNLGSCSTSTPIYYNP